MPKDEKEKPKGLFFKEGVIYQGKIYDKDSKVPKKLIEVEELKQYFTEK